jgi:hypothetical protein
MIFCSPILLWDFSGTLSRMEVEGNIDKRKGRRKEDTGVVSKFSQLK